ncbi:hypothetical protein PUNSTDRAFT_140979 [Punctularia strigosozonata HHB-11173 SS5]|uniref:uncharacterized protein n=1 Tax=Punctularia strigosozonata (strain HHB-11173) TaxID=741275 RepID=UPI00044177DB|nr:uncharacterized protein PUNSTDRAFT_140979 [Punctularia strigosozonata HHB-11173 SS5]EIN12137.1 hypothetical protein PUNSTDRAFT_140979 [Punctularia strigosozonata HHB-11173 SS5]
MRERGADVYAGYKISLSDAERWARKHSWLTDDDDTTPASTAIALAWHRAGANGRASIIPTDWPKALLRRNANGEDEFARRGTPIVLLARQTQYDPTATSSTCQPMEERESDRKFKAILEQDGLKPKWVTVPDPWFLLPSDYVRPKPAPSSESSAPESASPAQAPRPPCRCVF